MERLRRASKSPGLRRAGRLLLRAVGPAVLIVLLARVVDYGELRDIVSRIEIPWALAGLAMVQAMVLFRTLRWIDIHEAFLLPRASFLYQLRLSYATNFSTLVVPQIVSPFTRLVLLLQDGFRAQRAAAASAAEKVVEFLSFIAFGLYGTIYLASIFGALVWWALGAAVVAFGLGVGAYAARSHLDRLAAAVLPRLPGASASDEEGVAGLSELASLSRPLLARLWGWSLLAALAQATMLYFLARSLGVDLSYQFMVAAWGVIALTMMLPISVGGVGTREAVLVVAFNAVDRSTDAAVALGLLTWTVALVGSSPGAIEWLHRFLVVGRRPAGANDLTSAPVSAAVTPPQRERSV